MKGRAFHKDVSVSELMTLREQGLTNQQIADRLGVSYITIRRAISPQPDGLKAKPKRKAAPLPPVGNTPLPDMPHESFAERLEKAYIKKCEENGWPNSLSATETTSPIPSGPVGETSVRADGETGSEADRAREAHMKLIEEIHDAPYTSYKEAAQTRQSPVHELLAVFGTKTVRAYLKVALYAYGNPSVNLMNHDELLSALKTLNMEADAV